MTKKILLTFILAIFSSVGLYAYQRTNSAPKTATKSIAAKTGSLKISFAIDGKTSIERRDLKFTINGKISRINVKEGQEVKKGQLLMSLDTQDVQKNLQKDLKDFLITRNGFEQTTQVTYPSGSYVDNKDTIKRILENTQYSLDKSVLDVEIRNIALKESYLYAPIDGLVSAINIKTGETVNTQNGGVVLTITKPGSLYFESYAEDTEVLKVNKDQKTSIKIDAISGITFPAQVDFISNLAVVDQNGLSTYKIRAVITDSKSYSLLDGMSGQIQFITKEKTGILIVPNDAIFREDNQSYVKHLVSGEAKKVAVETGFTDGKEVEIISGLNQGDEVIIP